MNYKLFLILGFVLLFVVGISSSTLASNDNIKEKIKNKDLINDLRTKDTIREANLDKFKSYTASKKELLIEDKNYKSLINLKLVSPYTNYVVAGESVKVAEFLLIDHKKGVNIFDEIMFFNKNNDYDSQTRNFTLKYGVDYIEKECYLLTELEKEIKYCQNVTNTNWIEFNNLLEIPYKKNIKIGLFTDTTIGDKVEWIPKIQGFDILEWALWDVTSTTKFDFYTDSVTRYNEIVKIDDTHFLNVYTGIDNDAFATVLIVNKTDWSITKGTDLEFDTFNGDYFSVKQINLTHYLVTYADVNDDGKAIVLTISDTTITAGTPLEFDTTNGEYNSLVQIDSTHFLNAYDGGSGKAVVLTISDTTITAGTSLEFDSGINFWNDLTQIDETHYLNNFMSGPDYTGKNIVLTVNTADWTITNNTPNIFSSTSEYHSTVKINNTHYITTHLGANNDGYATLLTVNNADWTVTNISTLEFDTSNGKYHSLVQIDSTHFLNSYHSVYPLGKAIVLTINDTDLSISVENTYQFNNKVLWNSLAKIDNSHYITTFGGSTANGSAIVLTVEIPNEAPTILSSIILPTNPNDGNNLLGYCNASDGDSDDLTYYYKWWNGTTLYESSNTSNNYTESTEYLINTLSSLYLTEDEIWTFSCLANDGTDDSSWLNSTSVKINLLNAFNITLKNSSASLNTFSANVWNSSFNYSYSTTNGTIKINSSNGWNDGFYNVLINSTGYNSWKINNFYWSSTIKNNLEATIYASTVISPICTGSFFVSANCQATIIGGNTFVIQT